MAEPARKKRRARDSLSRDVILEAAEAVAVREGLDGLTFQAIGRELDAHPTSVYRHFRDKDELVLELIDALRSRSYGGDLVPSDDWRADLRLAAHTVHEHYLRYPAFAQQMASRTTRRPREFANVDFILGALRRAGLSAETAASCARAYGNMTRAMCGMEASLNDLPETTRIADETSWQVEYRQLSADDYPNIAAVGDHLASIGDPRIFSVAVELMLDGIEAVVAREASSGKGGKARSRTTRPRKT
ncbi:TetR/AcrR family transcriptional regulator [Nocardioidaceae bacterium SCSIO 66511]|nr:TetR/AcrR family transcriptional regulator [Nocardioidaceae bacterium SCSIO 66511]